MKSEKYESLGMIHNWTFDQRSSKNDTQLRLKNNSIRVIAKLSIRAPIQRQFSSRIFFSETIAIFAPPIHSVICFECDCNSSHELKLLDLKSTYGQSKIRLYVGYKYQVVSMTQLFHLLLCHRDTVITIWSNRTRKYNQIKIRQTRTLGPSVPDVYLRDLVQIGRS